MNSAIVNTPVRDADLDEKMEELYKLIDETQSFTTPSVLTQAAIANERIAQLLNQVV